MSSTNIERGDSRHAAVVDKQFNKRFSASPDYVRLAESTEDVRAAVDEAVGEGRRVVVTSGGHCLEGFVSDPDVRVIIDVSRMKGIAFDAGKNATAIEAGVTVGEEFRALFDLWGTVIPLGESVPWSTFYYQGNYPRLQRIKAQWDPRNVFRHALSVCGE